MDYDGQVLFPTLTGSLLSCFACSCILISYIIYAKQQQSFRHALVLNLSLAGRGPVKTRQVRANSRSRVYQLAEQLHLGHLCFDPWQDHARLGLHHQWLGGPVVGTGK